MKFFQYLYLFCFINICAMQPEDDGRVSQQSLTAPQIKALVELRQLVDKIIIQAESLKKQANPIDSATYSDFAVLTKEALRFQEMADNMAAALQKQSQADQTIQQQQ